MEEINLKELFEYIKERVLIIMIIMLVVLIVGCLYSVFLKTPMYKSQTSFVLVSDDGTASGGYSQADATLNKNLVATYSDLVKANRVIDKVINNLSLDYSVNGLKNHITVTNKTNTEIIYVSVEDKDRALAADIANELIKVFGEEIKDIYRLQNVSIVDKAVEAEAPYNVNVVKDIVIYLLVGIVLACGIIFVVFYFDTTIKSAEEVEKKLGIPVLGIVPKVKYKDKR